MYVLDLYSQYRFYLINVLLGNWQWFLNESDLFKSHFLKLTKIPLQIMKRFIVGEWIGNGRPNVHLMRVLVDGCTCNCAIPLGSARKDLESSEYLPTMQCNKVRHHQNVCLAHPGRSRYSQIVTVLVNYNCGCSNYLFRNLFSWVKRVKYIHPFYDVSYHLTDAMGLVHMLASMNYALWAEGILSVFDLYFHPIQKYQLFNSNKRPLSIDVDMLVL